MKVVKPQRLALLTRCLEFKGRFRMGISALLHVPLGPQPNLFSEVSLWKLAAEQLGPNAVVDAAIPKVVGEYIVDARAHPPQPDAVACRVRASVAGHEKVLHVIGDRHWTDGGEPSEPGPVLGMRLDWSRAWGGPDVAENPLGKGGEGERGADARELPNVEHPDHHVRARGDGRGRPAGFGPVDRPGRSAPPAPARMPMRGCSTTTPASRGTSTGASSMSRRTTRAALPLATTCRTRSTTCIDASRGGRTAAGFDARCCVRRAGHDPQHLQEVPLRLARSGSVPHVERAIPRVPGLLRHRAATEATSRSMLLCREHSAAPRPTSAYAETLARPARSRARLPAQRSNRPPTAPHGPRPGTRTPSRWSRRRAEARGDKLRRRQEREVRRVREEVPGYGLVPRRAARTLPRCPDARGAAARHRSR
jgi:hypothetical protein